MKPVRKSLTDAGFFKPTFGLSKRDERKEPNDMSTPWKSFYQACVEARILLGPPPVLSDTTAVDWYQKLLTLFVTYQSQALYELALVEAKRVAPNLSKDRQQAIIVACWPNWDKLILELHSAQERALTQVLLSKKPAAQSDDKPPGNKK